MSSSLTASLVAAVATTGTPSAGKGAVGWEAGKRVEVEGSWVLTVDAVAGLGGWGGALSALAAGGRRCEWLMIVAGRGRMRLMR